MEFICIRFTSVITCQINPMWREADESRLDDIFKTIEEKMTKAAVFLVNNENFSGTHCILSKNINICPVTRVTTEFSLFFDLLSLLFTIQLQVPSKLSSFPLIILSGFPFFSLPSSLLSSLRLLSLKFF